MLPLDPEFGSTDVPGLPASQLQDPHSPNGLVTLLAEDLTLPQLADLDTVGIEVDLEAQVPTHGLLVDPFPLGLDLAGIDHQVTETGVTINFGVDFEDSEDANPNVLEL
jgi:hypothetical protein